jgi:phenylacetate-CoA ligase
MSKFDGLYRILPVVLQNLAVSTYGLYWFWLRYGNGYRRFVDEYRSHERFSLTEWQKWQQAQLCALLCSASTQVPFYDKYWSRSEKIAARSGCLTELPLLDKAAVRDSPADFLRRDIRPFYPLIFHTSGSSGIPIATYWTVRELRQSMAFREVRSARWAGVSFSMPRATFSGRIVEPNPESDGPFYRFNRAEKQVYFSAFHLRPDTASYYVEALRKHSVQWLTGYAFSYYILGKFIIDRGLNIPPLKAVITTSEKLTLEMRNVIKKAYGCRVFEEYSTVENALFASECEYGRLHVSPDVGIVEILRPDGGPCGPEETGEVVTTCLFRNYQPFIRYRLGDLAAWDSEPCPCGRNMPVLREVIGRIEDVVIGSDGRQMVRFHGIFVDQPNVREGQIIQEALNSIRVKVVPTLNFGPSDIADIKGRIRQRLGDVEVIIERVDEIPRTKAGKFKAVVSLLDKKS